MGISDRLRERRQELGKTQEQVAHQASMNVTQYNAYEKGRSAPSGVTLPRLAHALQTTEAALMGHGQPAKPGRPISEHRGDVIRRLREEFRAQVAAELDLAPSDIVVRLEII